MKLKETETYEELLERFTKRLKQVNPEDKERVSYLQGCIDVVEYLTTGKLPNDGNHDGMKSHKPNKSYLTFQEKVIFTPRDDKPVEGHFRRDLDALD